MYNFLLNLLGQLLYTGDLALIPVTVLWISSTECPVPKGERSVGLMEHSRTASSPSLSLIDPNSWARNQVQLSWGRARYPAYFLSLVFTTCVIDFIQVPGTEPELLTERNGNYTEMLRWSRRDFCQVEKHATFHLSLVQRKCFGFEYSHSILITIHKCLGVLLQVDRRLVWRMSVVCLSHDYRRGGFSLVEWLLVSTNVKLIVFGNVINPTCDY